MRKNNMFRKLFFVSITVLLTFFLLNGISIATHGHQNPALNWGSTSGLDAILPPPGMYLSNYVANYSANDLLDEDGHNLKLPGGDAPELDLVAYAPQFIYVHEKKIFNNYSIGFQYFSTILQSINLDSDALSAESGTLGDMIFGPWIGRTEKLSEICLLHWIFEFDVYFSTGEYSEHEDINPSAN